MKKGEIWTIELPSTTASEQMGTRPSVIIAEADANISIIIPFTSNIQALKYSHTILVPNSPVNGLITDSVLLLFQIRAIDNKRILKKIGKMEEEYITQMDRMLLEMLKLKD